jgi:SpoVK/Ycf46/Vps4 family AAA+-type ATPase
MLDSVEKLDNVVLIATTNYPEKLEARVINRPS